MANDTYTEVTSQSWFSRLKDSFFGALFGLLLFAAAFFLLWTNEGRALKTADALREVQKTVTVLSGAEVSPQNEGKLIYVSGSGKTAELLADPSLGVSVNAVKLMRDVEMYQWVESSKSETKENIGGSKETVTTYTYNTNWSSTRQDSSKFKKPDGHGNPEMVYSSDAINAKNVSLGHFILSPDLVDKISATKPLVLQNADFDKIPEPIRSKAKLSGDYLLVGTQDNPEPNSPKVGDYRIRYRLVPPEISLSVISKQTSNTFEPYLSKNGQQIELLETGIVSADAMVGNAQKSNQLMTWLLRLLGFVLMFIGLALFFKPLSTIGAVIPLVGQILGAGTGLIAFLLALVLSLLTIAVAWFYYRPVFAVILLLIAALPVFIMIRKGRSAQAISQTNK